MTTRRVRHITIKDFKGIAEREIDVGDHGAVIHGRNASGKTSILDAVKAALGAGGDTTGTSAIRNGADRAEIFVDLGDAGVRRIISERGTSVEVTTGNGADRATIAKPATWLGRLIGAGQLDPLRLVLEKDRGKQRSAVLAALPMTVTVDQLREMVPELPADFSADGHALEVVGALRQVYETKRKEANALVKKLAIVANEVHAKIPPGRIPGEQEIPGAEDELTAAVRRRTELDSRAAEAAASEARVVTQREQIASLRQRAALGPDAEDVEKLVEATQRLDDEILALQDRLTTARSEYRIASERLNNARDMYSQAVDAHNRAVGLEAAIACAVTPNPTAEELQASDHAVASARDRVATHRRAVAWVDAMEAANDADHATDEATAKAKALDATVKKLGHDVPSKLIASSNAIPGLGIDGDDITLDGVALNQINDEARLRFAVKLAKRATPAVKVLITDGLERLDPDQYEAFLREATADGWQLLGARVDRGEIRIEAIEEATQS